MTLTIKLPDDLEERLASLSEEERERFTVEALREKIEEATADDAESYPLTTEDHASLARGFADSDAGRVRDGGEFLAELRQKLGLPARVAKEPRLLG